MKENQKKIIIALVVLLLGCLVYLAATYKTRTVEDVIYNRLDDFQESCCFSEKADIREKSRRAEEITSFFTEKANLRLVSTDGGRQIRIQGHREVKRTAMWAWGKYPVFYILFEKIKMKISAKKKIAIVRMDIIVRNDDDKVLEKLKIKSIWREHKGEWFIDKIMPVL